eukprot:TRINITY_DN8953_c0_g1_i2.p1 TRINITY_DN8953_c0_g1~~TRINITY_DN8953_c0_g1_i2.p1  ORF type:complete len:543 (+),score=123.99 TRINITY_DN8953_c0_g1_i2:46-1629(+)
MAAFDGSYNDTSFLRASRAIKFLRITRLLSLLRLLRVTRVIGLFKRWEDVISINSAWFRMAKLLCMMLLLAHWSGCVQFLAVQLDGFPHDSWVAVINITNESAGTQYTWSLFQALSHMLCIGYGRYPPRNITEVWLTIFSMVIGATFYAIFIGQMSSMMLSIDAASRAYSEKLSEVTEYMRARKLPAQLRRQVVDYYEYRWAQHKYFNEHDILDELSPGLKVEIIKQNCEPLVQALPFLRNAHADLIEAITTRVTFQVAMPGELVIKAGTLGSEMYLLQYGSVEVVLPNGTVVAELEDGSFFGEICLLKAQRRAASVRTLTSCKLYVLSREAFDNVLLQFPDMRESLEKTAAERLEELEGLQLHSESIHDFGVVASPLDKLQDDQAQQAQTEVSPKRRSSWWPGSLRTSRIRPVLPSQNTGGSSQMHQPKALAALMEETSQHSVASKHNGDAALHPRQFSPAQSRAVTPPAAGGKQRPRHDGSALSSLSGSAKDMSGSIPEIVVTPVVDSCKSDDARVVTVSSGSEI